MAPRNFKKETGNFPFYLLSELHFFGNKNVRIFLNFIFNDTCVFYCVAQKIARLIKNGAFKSRSTFVIQINRKAALDSMLLNRPKKIIDRRHTESAMTNNEMPLKSALKTNVGGQNDFRGSKSNDLGKEKVTPKGILKTLTNKPLTITGRRRSVGYSVSNAIETRSSSAPSRDTIDQTEVMPSNEIEKTVHKNTIEESNSVGTPELIPMPAPGSAITHTPMIFDLIDLSEDLSMSNSTSFGGDIGQTIEKEWSVEDCFGFSSNTSATTTSMDRSLATFDNLMESDVNYDRACLIPEPVHMHTNHTKSMNAIRKYVNSFRKEERILEDGLRTCPKTPLNIPALIPIRGFSHILSESHIDDPETIEMSINARSDFGRLGFDDEIRNEQVESQSEFDFHLHFSYSE